MKNELSTTIVDEHGTLSVPSVGGGFTDVTGVSQYDDTLFFFTNCYPHSSRNDEDYPHSRNQNDEDLYGKPWTGFQDDDPPEDDDY